MWKAVVTGTGLLAVTVVLVSAGLAMRGSRAGAPPAWSVAAEGDYDEGGAPDPSAAGVIAARANGYVYRLAPDGTQIGMSPATGSYQPSASGLWQAFKACPARGACQLLLGEVTSQGLQTSTVEMAGDFLDGAWSPRDDSFAAATSEGILYLSAPNSGPADRLDTGVTAFTWSANGSLLFATWDGSAGSLRELSRGRISTLTVLESAVDNFVPSLGASRFAFAQDGIQGWRLTTVDQSGTVLDVANLGRADVVPAVTRAPQVAISWSPDGSMISVSPVAAPFAMYLLHSDGSDKGPQTYYFTEGYAGEMKWSPDGAQLAVSTYSLDRKQHRIYVLASMANDEPRRLIDGCLIFWSPDSRYLVAKPEPYTNSIAAVRVSDGAFWTVSEHMNLTPAAWGSNDDDALKLAQLPARGVGGLGK